MSLHHTALLGVEIYIMTMVEIMENAHHLTPVYAGIGKIMTTRLIWRAGKKNTRIVHIISRKVTKNIAKKFEARMNAVGRQNGFLEMVATDIHTVLNGNIKILLR